MPGKSRIGLDAIIDAAISLIRAEGWEGLSARSLAKALKTSTMPIYSSIGSMEKLRGETRMRALSLLEDYQARPWTEDPLMNKAIGYIRFAREEGRLFRFVFDSRAQAPIATETVKEQAARDVEANADFTAAFSSMPREGMASIGFHSWIYVHGLACLLADGLIDMGDDELLRCLETAGGAFFTYISQNGG
jgi:AcrR family transcriptional regulator